MTAAAIIAAAAIAAGVSLYNKIAEPIGPLPVNLPTTPQSYLGVYANEAPASQRSDSVHERNRSKTRRGYVLQRMVRAVPDPLRHYGGRERRSARADESGWRIPAIAAGKYDGYLSAYAEAVRAYRYPVILSFGSRDERHLAATGATGEHPRRLRSRLAT